MTKNGKNDTNCAFFRVQGLGLNDLKAVIEIENSSFACPWSEQLFQEELKNPSSLCLKAVDENDELCGYIILRTIVDEVHLLNIATRPKSRKKGVAQKLIENAEQGFCCGKPLFLEVRISNKPALDLYKKLGFKQIYVRKRYYPDGEDAIVMEKDTCATAE